MTAATIVYRALLALYPSDYRQFFGVAMVDVFVHGARERRSESRARFAGFLAREFSALIAGAIGERVAKLTSPPLFRARFLRDVSLMRPPGASKRDWYSSL